MAFMPKNKKTPKEITIEFGDDFQDMDPPPAYELIQPVLQDMTERFRRYGSDRTGFVMAIIPMAELLLHDVDDDNLLDFHDRDEVYEELCEQLLTADAENGAVENAKVVDGVWARAVVEYVVKYVTERRDLAIGAMNDHLGCGEDGAPNEGSGLLQ